MNLDNLMSPIARGLFGLAFVLLAVSILEWAANVVGYTIVGSITSRGRMLEVAAVLAIFVVVVLLRQIRDRLPASVR